MHLLSKQVVLFALDVRADLVRDLLDGLSLLQVHVVLRVLDLAPLLLLVFVVVRHPVQLGALAFFGLRLLSLELFVV